MKGSQVLALAPAVVLAGALAGGGPLLQGQHESILNPATDRLLRVDKATGEVYVFSQDRGGWVNVRGP
jgi:hypothetical protein